MDIMPKLTRRSRARKLKTPRILIVIEGGCLQDVIADAPVRYVIKDWDLIKEVSPSAYSIEAHSPEVIVTPAMFDRCVRAELPKGIKVNV